MISDLSNRYVLFCHLLIGSQATGDYIGMVIRDKVLICVYKLGGVVHEVKTSQIMATNVNSSHYDNVVFRRYIKKNRTA